MRPLTLAPLPQWRDLFSAALNSAAPDEVLAAPWCRSGDAAFWFSRSAWSLVMVARWRQKLLGKQDVTFWLPDFFCNASLAPLRETGANLVFYPITDQLTPDLVACNALADHHPLDFFLLVHYFGQATPIEPIAAFCEEKGAWLIEDATHVLRPIPGVGEAGDCVLYSPHKHLPISDGAVLVVRPNGPAKLAEHGQAMGVLSEGTCAILDTPGYSNLVAVIWLLKRTLQRLGLRSRQLNTPFRAEIEPSVPVIPHPRMSAMARRLLTRLQDQLAAVAGLREQNAQDWHHVLSWADPASPVTPQMGVATPYLAGFSCTQEAGTETLFKRLQRASLPVTTWPDLPPEVMKSAGAHQAAIELRHNRLYLPVHQTLSKVQILACGKNLLDTVVTQWQARALSRDEWEGYWQRCPMTNLLQSWQYGAAKEQAEGWKVQRLLVTNEHGQPAALAQVLLRVIPIVGGIARLNRGPLLLTDLSADAEVPLKLAALRVLLRESRRQRLWMLQAAPEMPPSANAQKGLQALGFRKLSVPAWASGRLAVHAEDQALLMGLNGKWRNCLRKGEKLGVVVTHSECQGDALDLLIRSYVALQSNRGFAGLSAQLISALAAQRGVMWQFSLFVARESASVIEDEPLGVLVTIRSGDTTMYLIGSTSEKGRQLQANSVLLWHAILYAKRSGCAWFDIGGLSEATPKGIAEFKRGLNGMPYELVGEWRKYM